MKPGPVIARKSNDRTGFHYAWIVLGATFIGLIVAAAVRSEPGIILKSLEAEFGWSRQSITLAVSVNLFLFGFAGPFLGRLMDLYGPRRVSISTVILILIGTGSTLNKCHQLHAELIYFLARSVSEKREDVTAVSFGTMGRIGTGVHNVHMAIGVDHCPFHLFVLADHARKDLFIETGVKCARIIL